MSYTEAERGLITFWLLFLRAPHRWRLDYGQTAKACLSICLGNSDNAMGTVCTRSYNEWYMPLVAVYQYDINEFSYYSKVHSSWFVWSFGIAIDIMRSANHAKR